jgi:hypothetical protein
MTDVSNKNPWDITANRYVAYLDIMGFKDMVARSTHDQIYSMMKEINNEVKSNTEIRWIKGPIKYVETTTYSDSLIIYSKDDSYESLYSFICAVSATNFTLLSKAIPHKGAVAFGTMTLDNENSIFFGQPLIDAYLLQEELNFYGIVAHATAERSIMSGRDKDNRMLMISDYSCPFKKGNSIHLVITPLFLYKEMSYDEEKEKLFLMMHEMLMSSFSKMRFLTSGYLRKYIDNTESYLQIIKGRLSKNTTVLFE